jgi:hypothetical protein
VRETPQVKEPYWYVNQKRELRTADQRDSSDLTITCRRSSVGGKNWVSLSYPGPRSEFGVRPDSGELPYDVLKMFG